MEKTFNSGTAICVGLAFKPAAAYKTSTALDAYGL